MPEATSVNMLSDIIAHFAKNGEQPNWWAHPDDQSEFCLDHRSSDGSQFWLSIADDHIRLLWKPAGADEPVVIKFVPEARFPT
jgi:hypothetical protein